VVEHGWARRTVARELYGVTNDTRARVFSLTHPTRKVYMLRAVRNLLLVVALATYPMTAAAGEGGENCEPSDWPGCSSFCESEFCSAMTCCEEERENPVVYMSCGGETWTEPCLEN